VCAAAAVMALVTWATHIGLLHAVPGGSFVLQAARLFVTISVSLAVLAAAAHVLRIAEFSEARDLIVGRLKRMAG
jgi:hypothetical protein